MEKNSLKFVLSQASKTDRSEGSVSYRTVTLTEVTGYDGKVNYEACGQFEAGREVGVGSTVEEAAASLESAVLAAGERKLANILRWVKAQSDEAEMLRKMIEARQR
jgi:hypothetical protein